MSAGGSTFLGAGCKEEDIGKKEDDKSDDDHDHSDGDGHDHDKDGATSMAMTSAVIVAALATMAY